MTRISRNQKKLFVCPELERCEATGDYYCATKGCFYEKIIESIEVSPHPAFVQMKVIQDAETRARQEGCLRYKER